MVVMDFQGTSIHSNEAAFLSSNELKIDHLKHPSHHRICHWLREATATFWSGLARRLKTGNPKGGLEEGICKSPLKVGDSLFTLAETKNLKIGLSRRDTVFQPSFSSGYVSCKECMVRFVRFGGGKFLWKLVMTGFQNHQRYGSYNNSIFGFGNGTW